ncbi:chloramphenicol-sensitive protein RarD [Pseudoalteromonas undina]|jgi:chloramphenicol-sensitive protein RarD|uniref:Transporter n=1 Tax=Pseudoalteromonas undina TaxID=43660 RepID=A0ABP2XX87_9GAMM|nr:MULTISPECIES: EamA family transporter RarD [Pseudoalteromonas]MBL0688215.1 EamA family transporter RarD [Pseudoalteromonas sp.]OLF76490.1 chloramphenical resistance permease RarD [Pseudoalteromonas haloplanktis]KAF7765399.1 chloramphenicol-sensitive protein RarD [Pseudoalteromonas undina]KPH91183.1 chloramphenical resistance permease RarD [Pseudoalteromonas undina]KPZ64990.1 EamA-like transporter family protein [Pseudoalteromonas sp. P1-16-1b]|tara:strand:- start:275 stop:1195 length:921 start_codon:yes stop_codon:yes gene_type:complete
MSIDTEQRKGAIFACLAFFMWGLAPIYFKMIQHVSAFEILMHRVIWSVVFLIVVVSVLSYWDKIKRILIQPKLILMLVVTSTLLGFNWGLFIWAINNNHMLDASLGYYINPLLNVLLGMVFLNERLRKLQGAAVALAFTGVLLQLISFGSFPVVAFSLATSFALYGLLRKKLQVDALPGILIEALILLPVALTYWWLMVPTETSNLPGNDWLTNVLLVSAGIVTTLPLLCFTGAAKRLQYTTLGFFQYIGPSLMFILAVVFYGEVFDAERVITFACIWSALAIFSWDSYHQSRKRRKAAIVASGVV